MRNSAVNSHDAKKKLSFVMCVAAHCSLTCINNHINADLNNPYRCVMWNNVVNNHDAKKKDCRLLCAQLHIVRSHELRIALMRNNEINNHDATNRLLSVMYAVAHVHSHAPRIPLMWFSIIRVGLMRDAKQCDQQSSCKGQIVVCNVRYYTFTHMH